MTSQPSGKVGEAYQLVNETMAVTKGQVVGNVSAEVIVSKSYTYAFFVKVASLKNGYQNIFNVQPVAATKSDPRLPGMWINANRKLHWSVSTTKDINNWHDSEFLINLGEWTFVAITVSNENHVTKLYTKGMDTGSLAIQTETINGELLVDSTAQIYMSERTTFPPIDGCVKQFMFFAGVLSDDEIRNYLLEAPTERMSRYPYGFINGINEKVEVSLSKKTTSEDGNNDFWPVEFNDRTEGNTVRRRDDSEGYTVTLRINGITYPPIEEVASGFYEIVFVRVPNMFPFVPGLNKIPSWILSSSKTRINYSTNKGNYYIVNDYEKAKHANQSGYGNAPSRAWEYDPNWRAAPEKTYMKQWSQQQWNEYYKNQSGGRGYLRP